MQHYIIVVYYPISELKNNICHIYSPFNNPTTAPTNISDIPADIGVTAEFANKDVINIPTIKAIESNIKFKKYCLLTIFEREIWVNFERKNNTIDNTNNI